MAKFSIELESPKSDSPEQAVRRLRAWLKGAGRAYGLRCTRCKTEDTPDESDIVSGDGGGDLR